MEEGQDKVVLISKSTRNLIVGTAFVAILLTITAWAGSLRTENAKKDALAADVAALAASFKNAVLEARSLRSDMGRARLEPLVIDVAKAGSYNSVVLADSGGSVIATTDGVMESRTLDPETLPKKGPVVERRQTGLWAGAPIMLGGEPIGYIFVQTGR